MTHRTDRVHLDPKEPRCEPAKPCARKFSCARYMATLPPKYGSMIAGPIAGGECGSFVHIEIKKK